MGTGPAAINRESLFPGLHLMMSSSGPSSFSGRGDLEVPHSTVPKPEIRRKAILVGRVCIYGGRIVGHFGAVFADGAGAVALPGCWCNSEDVKKTTFLVAARELLPSTFRQHPARSTYIHPP